MKTNTTINHEEFAMNNVTVYQFSIKNYCVTYIGGQDKYRVINYDTKKEGFIMLLEKNKNIEFIKNEMDFMTGNNNLKMSSVFCLDKLK
jgi:hypothetical protein